MNQTITCVVVLFALFCLPALAQEKLVHSKGMAEIRFEGASPTAAQLKEADFQAKENSINRYLSKYRPAVLDVYSDCATPLSESTIDKVVIDTLSKPPKTRGGVYRVAMRTSINTARLDKYLEFCSGGITEARLAIVLVARQAINKQSEGLYKSFFGQVDKALADVFIAKNFTVDSKRDMELFSGGLYREVRLMEQYKTAGQVNWESAFIASDLNNIDLLVLGYFDVGNVSKVKLNSMLQVSVSASAETLDLVDKKVISGTRKIQRKAEAPTEKEVINEAVQLVVEEMGQQLTDELIRYYMSR